jgi:hypothetical protein
MNFRTVVEPKIGDFAISHSTPIMLLGSCFVENIGIALQSLKFNVDLNPFGVIYNPVSISRSIQRMIDYKAFTEDELFYHNEKWNSFMHHSRFSEIDKRVCLDKINERLRSSSEFLKSADALIITFGTAWVFYLAENDTPVSNCHKLPASKFNRRLFEIDSIVEEYTSLLHKLKEFNSKIKVIFTVSPVRHMKDGAEGNQLSKSTLIVAVQKLCKAGLASYFPSYEIVMDDLRDYRFYNSDMLHPSDQAVEYIFEKFSNSYFSEETIKLNSEIAQINSALNHRPTNINSESHRKFVSQLLEKISNIEKKYPIDFGEEKARLSAMYMK